MKNNCKIVAIIPARSGSKSIIDKNMIELEGFPLFMYSYAAAKMSKYIDEIIFSTNDRNYKKIAESYGLKVPFLRPNEFSKDTSTDREFLLHAMNWCKSEYSYIPEYWVHLRPTTPLRSPEVIDKAIELILNEKNSTSLRSGHLAPESPFKWFKMTNNGKYFESININNSFEDEIYNMPKEIFEDVYIPNGYIDIVKFSYMYRKENIHGNKILAFKSPVCTEIDSVEELEFIKYELKNRDAVTLNYLKKMYNSHD